MAVISGRTCPLSYRVGASRLRSMPRFRTETLYVVGGLYGNLPALHAVQRRVQEERKPTHTIFNGDFNFFNAAPEQWREVNGTIRKSARTFATLGNVEIEATGPASDAGCGCGYPEYVSDGVVERSNEIVARLRAAVCEADDPDLVQWIRSLPMGMVVELGAERRPVGIVHGDPDSLAGWGLAVEVQEPLDHALRNTLGCTSPATSHSHIHEWSRTAGVQAFLCTHTCLPFFQDFPTGRAPADVDAAGAHQSDGVFIGNNGAAGLPNFSGHTFGLATRVSADMSRPHDSLYGMVLRGLRYDAIPIHYDSDAWLSSFVSMWPEGSAAHLSYNDRIVNGPAFTLKDAARGNVELYVEA